jgi:ribosomal-protein-alanine N-acetyltransferase
MKIDKNITLQGNWFEASVTLRLPIKSDFNEWVSLRRNNVNYLKPWEPERNDSYLLEKTYLKRLRGYNKMFRSGKVLPFNVFRSEDMRMIGVCNILNIQRHISQTAEIGYWIGERYAGLNFGKSAVSAVTNFCFDQLSLNRVEAAVMVKNAPSISILRTLGYKKEGISRQKLKINGKWEDHYIFSRIASDTFL